MALIQAGTAPPDAGAVAREGPIAPSDRIVAIDSVRGIALFGVMAINIVTGFRVSIFAQFLAAPADGTWLDRAVYSALMAGIDLKAFALFSLLFGLGLAIQFDHLAVNPRRTVLLMRRLAFLMLVGAIHIVFVWNGDILLEYAIAGVIVLAFLMASTRTLAIAGGVLLAVFIAAPFLPPIASLPDRAWMVAQVADSVRIYGSGGFADMMVFRLREVPAIVPLHVLIFPRTVALMLIGAALWRAGFFRNDMRLAAGLGPAAAVAILVGGALAVSLHNGWLGQIWRLEPALERMATILLACGYGAAIVWAACRPRARMVVVWAAPIGRMAFTNYLLQSVIFGWLFYGYGLGLFGKMGIAAAFTIGTIVYAVQVVVSTLWLRRYLYGPLEWLWRSAMYGAWQTLRRA